jgi:hypothetical protein
MPSNNIFVEIFLHATIADCSLKKMVLATFSAVDEDALQCQPSIFFPHNVTTWALFFPKNTFCTFSSFLFSDQVTQKKEH